MAVLKIGDREFDSAQGELTLGDMEELERAGINFMALAKGGQLPMAHIKVLARICLRKADPSVDEHFIDDIPVTQLNQLAEYINDFFGRCFGVDEKTS